MSASERLRERERAAARTLKLALSGIRVQPPVFIDAMPEIIDVVEAAENPDLFDFDDRRAYPAQKALDEALDALNAKLDGAGKDDCPVMGRDYPEFRGFSGEND